MIGAPVDAQCQATIDRSGPDEVIVRFMLPDGPRSAHMSFVQFDAFIAKTFGPAQAAALKSSPLRNEAGELCALEPLPHGKRWLFTLAEGEPLRIEQRRSTRHPMPSIRA